MVGLLLFLILLSVVGYYLHRTFLNSLTLFYGIWGFIILLYSFQLSHHLNDLSNRSLIVFFLTFAMFMVGYLVSFFVLNKTTSFETLREHQPTAPQFILDINQSLIDKGLAFIIIFTIIQGIFSGGYPLAWLLLGIGKNYTQYGIPTFNGLLMSFIIFFGTLLYILNKEKPQLRLQLYLLVIFFIPVLVISRQVLVTLLIQIAIIKLIYSKKINYKKVIPSSIILVTLFGLIGNLRTGLSKFVEVADIKSESIPYLLSGFYWVYMYLTMTVANLNSLFSKANMEFAYGWNMLNSFFPTIIVDTLYIDSFTSKLSSYLVSINFTVSGYMAKPYLDFGIIGLVVYTLVLGVLAYVVYHNFKKNINYLSLMIFVVFTQIILMSFFTDFLLYLPVSFQFFWIFVFRRYLYKPHKK
ncbi:O-antigen polymerase [Salirhabdus salicampi]|uniref:O-antigen polymerase n=1 Tax=Salirhabdus salicampi TaxID=476102 RepID=UPI0020C3A8EB|nr:O-antigen polymerase [Salirhabdus salicampi]MCP8617500.1 oligosaccharide repeat unit polymerase [Salirhabdus salicampi]